MLKPDFKDSSVNMSFPGLYVGIVKNTEDPNKVGRIQISIPSIFGQSSSETVWARPCFIYGHFFVPEKSQRVWVAFENANPNSPVYLGIWYPEGQVPEEVEASPSKTRVIKTSSGNSITFDDSESEAGVEIRDKNENIITLDGDGIRIATKTGGSILITDSGITVNSNQEISVEAPNVKLKSNVSLGTAPVAKVICQGDQGIGNLGAPVVITTLLNTERTVKA